MKQRVQPRNKTEGASGGLYIHTSGILPTRASTFPTGLPIIPHYQLPVWTKFFTNSILNRFRITVLLRYQAIFTFVVSLLIIEICLIFMR